MPKKEGREEGKEEEREEGKEEGEKGNIQMIWVCKRYDLNRKLLMEKIYE